MLKMNPLNLARPAFYGPRARRLQKKLPKAWLCFGFMVVAGSTACGPDNEASCNEAEAALIAAYEDCDVDNANQTSLECDLYAETSADCSDHFGRVEETAKCEDGTVTFEYGDACF